MHAVGLILAGLLASPLVVGAQTADKKIEVTVNGSTIVVPDSEARVRKIDLTIIWELPQQLAANGYKFPANGIVFRDAPAGTFSNCRPIAGGSKFQCKKDKHQSQARYKYDVNVNQANSALPTLDPFVNLE